MEDAIGKNLEVFVTKTEAQATASDFVAAHPAALCVSSDTKSIVFGGQVLTLGDHQAKVNKWVDEKRVLKLNGLEAVGSATINSSTIDDTTSTDQLIWATDKRAVYLKRDGQYYNNWTEYKMASIAFIFGSDYCQNITASGCLAVIGVDLYLISKFTNHIQLTSASGAIADGSLTESKLSQDLAEKINRKADASALETKAPKVGYAPNLKVGFSEELIGRGNAEPQIIGKIRPTGGISINDYNATIERVKGNSVVWNQLSNISEYKKYPSASSNIELSISDGILNVTNIAYEGNGADVVMIYCSTSRTPQIGDKIFVDVNFKSPNASLIPLVEFCNIPLVVKNGGIIYSAVKEGERIYIKPNGTKSIGDTWTFSNIQVVNLTQMFGAGNEPMTIEEFEARRPFGVTDDYNEGEIISYDGVNELKSVGFNAYNGTYAKVIGGKQYHAYGNIESLTFATELDSETTTAITLDSENKFIPETDGFVFATGSGVCIHLTHTYTPEHTAEYEEDILQLPDVKAIKDKDGNQLFPYGLLSAGSVHDEITATKAVKRVGRYVIDGSQKWTAYNQKFRLTNPKIECRKASYNLLTSRYNALKGVPDGGWTNFPDNSILIHNVDVKMFVAWDSSYSTAEDFQASLVGSPIIVYYELAEPIEVDLEEPINLTYYAWDFGTEELITESKTTPLKADIVYDFNAVDRIRENTTKVISIEERVAQLEALLAQTNQTQTTE